jgi:hypothetical protein
MNQFQGSPSIEVAFTMSRHIVPQAASIRPDIEPLAPIIVENEKGRDHRKLDIANPGSLCSCRRGSRTASARMYRKERNLLFGC